MMRAEQTGHFFDESVLMRVMYSSDNRTSGVRYNALTPKLALQLAVPHTWAASVFPSLFGILYCIYRSFGISAIEAALLLSACVLMQAAVNTFNDYMDFVKGTDSLEDNLEKEDAVLLYAGVDPHQVRNLAFAFLGTAALIGIGFTVKSGPLPLAIGLLGGLIVLLYSGGPLPISYLPIGEITSGVVMGALIPLGITAAVTGKFHPEILPLTLPLVTGIGLIMMTNNTCDIEKDLKAGRKTFSGCIGREKAVRVYRLAVILWMLLIALDGALLGRAPLTVALLGVFAAYIPAYRFLMRSPLLQSTRVAQMKGILKANICSGIVCLAILLAAIAVR